MKSRLLVVIAAGLGHEFLRRWTDGRLAGLQFQPVASFFPALTCTVQAGLRTASPPAQHGLPGNGYLDRDLGRPLFWEQSARLVRGERIWSGLRGRGGRVAMLFWQQSLGEEVDFLVSPAPIHLHGGGMVEDCYAQPAGLYARLCTALHARFRLHTYWGPLASARASTWIARATAVVLQERDLAPELCLTYLPALDYDLQRYGPDDRRSRAALAALDRDLAALLAVARQCGYEALVLGDYAIGATAGGPVFPNRLLREGGWLQVRAVGRRLYPDLAASQAFGVVDHEVAHVYARGGDLAAIRARLAALPGVGEVLDAAAQARRGLAGPRSGDLVLVAQPGRWFAYPWWQRAAEAPDYASHVDIHNKPGYDPCELFFGWPPLTVSRDPGRIGGSHGRVGPDRLACWAATFALARAPQTQQDLAEDMRRRLEAMA